MSINERMPGKTAASTVSPSLRLFLFYPRASLHLRAGLPHEHRQATSSVDQGLAGLLAAGEWICCVLRRCLFNLLPKLIGVAALVPRVS